MNNVQTSTPSACRRQLLAGRATWAGLRLKRAPRRHDQPAARMATRGKDSHTAAAEPGWPAGWPYGGSEAVAAGFSAVRKRAKRPSSFEKEAPIAVRAETAASLDAVKVAA
eukprot:scaffold24577_cov62-Isochrysis_galbana.AAC.1